jgi:hypothetical protein
LGATVNVIYVKGRQTVDTTINENGIDDGTFPVQSFNVSNVNVRNAGNILQYVASGQAGAVIPNSVSGLSSNGGGHGIAQTTASLS